MTQVLLERFESQTATALHRPEPGPDEAEAARAEAEALAAEEAAVAAAKVRREEAIAAAIATLCETVSQSRTGAIQVVAAELGQAVASALPGLLDEGFATEAALACAEISETAPIAEAALRASPNDTEVILAVLERQPPARPIAVTADPSLPDGQVRLDWGTGGAVFDSAAWADRICTIAAARIEARVNEGVEK